MLTPYKTVMKAIKYNHILNFADIRPIYFKTLNAELNPICHFLALLWAHHIFHVSRIRVNQCLLQNDSPYRSASAFFLHPLTPIDFASFSRQFTHFNFGLPAFLLLYGFSRNTFFTVLSSNILTRWRVGSSLCYRPSRFKSNLWTVSIDFDVVLTVHLTITLVNDQLDANSFIL